MVNLPKIIFTLKLPSKMKNSSSIKWIFQLGRGAAVHIVVFNSQPPHQRVPIPNRRNPSPCYIRQRHRRLKVKEIISHQKGALQRPGNLLCHMDFLFTRRTKSLDCNGVIALMLFGGVPDINRVHAAAKTQNALT